MQDRGNPTIAAFRSCAAFTPPLLHLSSSLFCRSHGGKTAVARQALPSVHPRTVLLCVCMSCFVTSYEIGTNTYSQSGSINWMLRMGPGRYKPTLPRGFKSNRAASVHNTTMATVQQRYNISGKTAPAHEALAFVTVTVFRVSLCSVYQEMDDKIVTTFFTSNFKINQTSSNLILSPNTNI